MLTGRRASTLISGSPSVEERGSKSQSATDSLVGETSAVSRHPNRTRRHSQQCGCPFRIDEAFNRIHERRERFLDDYPDSIADLGIADLLRISLY
jgi:hypothetical protein